MATWLKDAIFYEIYPQSFYDTNGDGIVEMDGKPLTVQFSVYKRAAIAPIATELQAQLKQIGIDVQIKNFEKATGIQIPYEIKPRRAGDIATCYSDVSKAKRELGWEAEYGILEMCRDSWNWQKKNPNGY